MKHHYLIFLLYVSAQAEVTTQPTVEKKEQKITLAAAEGHQITLKHLDVNVNVNNEHHIDQHNENKAYAHQWLQNFSLQSVQPFAQEARKQFFDITDFCKEYVISNKYSLGLKACGLVYGAVWLKLLYHAHLILRDDTWSCWKQSIPFDVLSIMPEQELGKELIVAAQQQYQTADTLHDLLSPLMMFLQDVDKEHKQLTSFIRMHDWLSTLHITWLFPKQIKLVACAQEKAKRLNYLKAVFIRWVTDYKLALNTPITRSRKISHPVLGTHFSLGSNS
ncbi:MAG: hypothetical protein AB7R69_00630 [Candidatus Babeliales bacterium]